MAKRPYDEAVVADNSTEHSNGLARKKSKKSKRTAEEAPAAIEGKSADIEAQTLADEGAEVAAVAKAERKAARKAEKAARKAEKAQLEGVSAQPAGGEVEEENTDNAATELARKEAKRAKKAAREAEKVREEVVEQQAKKEKKEKRSRKSENVAQNETARGIEAAHDDTSATHSEPTIQNEKKEKKLKKSRGAADNGATNGMSTTTIPSTGTSNYTQHASLSALSSTKIEEYLSSKQITVDDPLNPKSLYRPMISFEYLPISEESQLAPFKNFDAPTPIQAAAWPSLFARRDMIGVAETGSGKTLAFGVPCIQSMRATSGGKQIKGVKALIISPTRELASQIYDQLTVLAKPAGLFCACIYGGVPKDPQYEAMKKANIVVATPGRLNDLISEGVVDLGKVNYLVLDEADRMLEKGFEEEIKKIIGQTPTTGRQTLMFTATWPPSVRDLAMTFMKDPVRITIGDNHSGELRANVRITQQVEVIDQYEKQNRLIQLLKQHQSGAKRNDRILVFCLYKKEATRIEQFIGNKGFRVAGIHGDLGQQQRTASLEAFKKGEVPILVATDVAARGLDIPAVKVVINVTFPLTAEDYVHRIGRTGRAGQTGLAVTLFTEHDKGLSGALINVLKGANQPVPEDLLKFGTTVKKKSHEAYGAFFKDTGDMKKATKITFD